MSKLRLCSGSEAVKKFERAGWKIARRQGSHVMMVKSDYPYTLSIPLHKGVRNWNFEEVNKTGKVN